MARKKKIQNVLYDQNKQLKATLGSVLNELEKSHSGWHLSMLEQLAYSIHDIYMDVLHNGSEFLTEELRKHYQLPSDVRDFSVVEAVFFALHVPDLYPDFESEFFEEDVAWDYLLPTLTQSFTKQTTECVTRLKRCAKQAVEVDNELAQNHLDDVKMLLQIISFEHQRLNPQLYKAHKAAQDAEKEYVSKIRRTAVRNNSIHKASKLLTPLIEKYFEDVRELMRQHHTKPDSDTDTKAKNDSEAKAKAKIDPNDTNAVRKQCLRGFRFGARDTMDEYALALSDLASDLEEAIADAKIKDEEFMLSRPTLHRHITSFIENHSAAKG